MKKERVIARMKGGLGNQLFAYAAARRLALANGVEMVIDDRTGFVRDLTYRRMYGLDYFSIPCRKATAWERMEPFERGRRAVAKWVSRGKPFVRRAYIEQEGLAFENRLLALRIQRSVCLDGYWQDERYFADIAETLRSDLAFAFPPPAKLREQADEISGCQSVALHVRWFDPPGVSQPQRNLPREYYLQAIDAIQQRVHAPYFFLFSDNLEAARQGLGLSSDQVRFVGNNPGDEGAIFDLWLMSQCKHFIMANSTFSWWGAWLGRANDGVILMPGDVPRMDGGLVWDGSGGWSAGHDRMAAQ